MPPRLAVAAVLAAVGVAAGGYYLWPKGRDVPACAPANISEAAREALASYTGRIRHDVERTDDSAREETWYDPLSGTQRLVSFGADGLVTVEIGTIRHGKTVRSIWVAPREHTWYVNRDPISRPAEPNEAAVLAQTYREEVAQGKAKVVGPGRLRDRDVVELHRTAIPLRLSVPGGPAPTGRAPALEIDTWVDPLTYVPLRIRTESAGHWSQVDSTWLPRTAANVAKTKVVIPRGFRRIHPRVYSGSEKVVVSRAGSCGQS